MTVLEVALKMSTTKGLGLSNMHLFDASGQIQRFETPWDILCEYAPVRLSGYVLRRQKLLERLRSESSLLFNRVRFIELVMDDVIVLSRKSREEVELCLEEHGLERGGSSASDSAPSYDYLLDMPLSSITSERKAALDAQLSSKLAEIARIENTTPEDMWLCDISALESVIAPV
jgi:DNA topoisomerase-2